MPTDRTPKESIATPGAALTLSEEILRHNLNGIFAIDEAGRVALWNLRMEQYTGIASAAAVGRPVLEVLPFLKGPEGDPLRSALLGASTASIPRPFPPPPRGPAAFLEITYEPLLRDDGAASGAVATLRDVTEQRRTEELLEESESRFRIMADGAPVLLWMATQDGECTFFNQGWLEFTGRTLEAEFGVGWAAGVHAEDFQRCMTVYLDAFVERRDFRMEYRLRRADGQYRWILDTGRPRFAYDGTFEGYIGSCIDITELRESSAALRKLNNELEDRVERRTAELKQANAELEAFSYSVSHDLRAPLRAIDGFSNILLELHGKTLDASGRHYLDRICKGAGRMGDLIDDLLHLSTLSRAELRPSRIDLSALARAVVEDLRKADPNRGVDVIIGDGLEARGDPGLVRIVLENLLGNAWKFTRNRPDARVEIGCSRADAGRPVFFVRDNGAGFDMAYADKLFGAFQRLHPEAQFEGTGIGLATVARIVRRHGGKIWAEGVPDRGATFSFTLRET